MAHAKSYLRDHNRRVPPVYETRPASEADIRKLSTRLSQPTLDEITALSKFQPVSFLLQDMNRKRVIYEWARPDWPVAILDINPIKDWDEAYIWLGLTDCALKDDCREPFEKYIYTLFDQLNGCHRQLLHHVAVHNSVLWRWLEQQRFYTHRRLSHHGDKNMEYGILRRVGY